MSRRGRPGAWAWTLTCCLRGHLNPGRQAQTEASHPAEAGRKPLSPELKAARRFPSPARVLPTSKGTWGRRAASCPIPAGKGDHVHGRTPGQVGHRPREKPGSQRGEEPLCLGPWPASLQGAGRASPSPSRPAWTGAPRGLTERSSSLHLGPVRESPAALGFFNLRCF